MLKQVRKFSLILKSRIFFLIVCLNILNFYLIFIFNVLSVFSC